jgi:hypothetical protein
VNEGVHSVQQRLGAEVNKGLQIRRTLTCAREPAPAYACTQARLRADKERQRLEADLARMEGEKLRLRRAELTAHRL